MQNECFVLSRDGIHFSAKSGPRNKIDAYGTLYISTLRMVFVNEKAGSDTRGFDIPLATLYKESFNQPIFGANNMTGLSPPLDLPEGADHWKWCISFRNGGVGTFLPFFFRLLQEMRRRMQEASAPTAQPTQVKTTRPPHPPLRAPTLDSIPNHPRREPPCRLLYVRGRLPLWRRRCRRMSCKVSCSLPLWIRATPRSSTSRRRSAEGHEVRGCVCPVRHGRNGIMCSPSSARHARHHTATCRASVHATLRVLMEGHYRCCNERPFQPMRIEASSLERIPSCERHGVRYGSRGSDAFDAFARFLGTLGCRARSASWRVACCDALMEPSYAHRGTGSVV